jgi:hypothetical protein
MSTPKLKVHARDPYFDERARCGAHYRGPVQFAGCADEVTCRTCRGWLPVPERPLPSERAP